LPPKKIAKTPSKKLTALPPGDVAADTQRAKESPGLPGLGDRQPRPPRTIRRSWESNSVEAFKRALLNAKSITYLPVPGVPQLIERLGLKDDIASKVTIPNADISSELVRRVKSN